MHPVRKPTWQQATALVSLSTCGAMTGFAFAHDTVSEMTSPTRMPVHLVALKKPARPGAANAGSATAGSTGDSALRSAIVQVATNYLQMAQTRSPAAMEALIWGTDSTDGVDHGESCAAFASLTLALGAQAAGQESWVTGGTTYPWPLHQWADVRVDANPDSPQIISIMQDAQAHNRWHPLGDGYQPQPGDWVLFDGHVEVITGYSAGVLSTIGGDSAPNLSVNAHKFTGPLAAQGVTGFVDNGKLAGQATPAASGTSAGGAAAGGATAGAAGAAAPGGATQGQASAVTASAGEAAIPGTRDVLTARTNRTGAAGRGATGRGGTARKGTARMAGTANGAGGVGTASMVAMPGMMNEAGAVSGNGGTAGQGSPARAGTPARAGSTAQAGTAARSGTPARTGKARGTGRNGTAGRDGGASRAGSARGGSQGLRSAQGPRAGTAAIPGVPPAADDPGAGSAGSAAPSYTRNNPPAAASPVPGTAAQQAFISEVAPGALAAQSRYGIPAAVTIAQAIDESGWGQSALAIRDHNLFGIKGSGPAGSDMLPTQEFEGGQWVTVNAAFRVYHNIAESIADHSQLLATGDSYRQAMADRQHPDAFAADLTGVYATDPQYGSNLIALMRLYNLYRYDTSTPAAAQAPAPAATQAPAPGGASAPAAAPSQGGVVADGGTAGQGQGQSGTASPGQASQGQGQSGTASQGQASRGQGRGGTSRQGAATRQGTATIPGVLDAYTTRQARSAPAAEPRIARGPQAGGHPTARVAPRQAGVRVSRYTPQIPRAVTTAFLTSAKTPLSRAEPLYEDVASRSGIRWQLLAACDWMQCQAQPRYSPVHGEKLGTVNASGTMFRTKSEALAQCAGDLVELAMAVYWIDITARRPLSVRELAKVFAAFRWGGLLKLHGISAMEFPYSVEGLTAQHLKMRWPDIKDPNAPDKPGTRFRMPFGAVPVVLCLGYPALAIRRE